MFHELEGSVIILRSKGVFRQTKAYTRNGYIYAGHGSGFIRMCERGTSVPNIGWEYYNLGVNVEVTSFGYLVEAGHPEGVRQAIALTSSDGE